ncbi:hypothetical protein BH10CYA1_BH10CYA1_55250 [soil metagenome]
MLDKQELDSHKTACDATLSRKEFLTKLVQRAAVAGSLIAAPKIIDKFLVPPAQALNSTTTVHDTSGAHDQTQHFHDTHAPLRNGSHGGGGHGGSHDGGSHDGGSHNDNSPTSSPSNNKNRKDPGFDPDSGWG